MKMQTKITIMFFLLISLILIVGCESEVNEMPLANSDEVADEPEEVLPDSDKKIPVDENLENTDLDTNSECSVDSDCVPARCCHADTCVPVDFAPDCSDLFCTQECQAGTIDCGGNCFCDNGTCNAKLNDLPTA